MPESGTEEDLEDEDSSEDDVKRSVAPAPRKRHNFDWIRPRQFPLPSEVIRHITTFLDDDTRWHLRSTNLLFYGAYYSQTITLAAGRYVTAKQKFNAMRALRLARYGNRRFPNVEVLDFRNEK